MPQPCEPPEPGGPTGGRPVGAGRTATALAARTGWPVRTRDVAALAARGHLTPAGTYQDRTLYDRAQAAALPAHIAAAAAGCDPAGPPPGPAVAAFAGHLAEVYGIAPVTAYRPRSGRWLIDWPVLESGAPDPAGLRGADLAAHPAGAHRARIGLATPAHRAIAAARRALAPGAAVVLDTETTGLGPGAVAVEVAVIDAATGAVLLDTLVSPGGVPVDPSARAVHGITDAELAGAPAWAQVWPRLCAAVAGRTVLAYNALFDARVIAQTCRAHGRAAPRWAWVCAKRLRGDAARRRAGRLGAVHRAAGDAQAAREILRTVAATPYTPDTEEAQV